MFAFWAAQFHRQNMKYAVDNLPDAGLLRAASDAGADFLTCPSVWPMLDAPAGVRPFSRALLAA